MNKKLFNWIIGLVICISCCFGLAACDQGLTVTGIEIVSPASTLVYEEGEEFSSDGLSIKLKYSDGSYSEELELSNLTISSPDMESAGTKNINISYVYEGQKYEIIYTITVNEHVHLFNLENVGSAHLKSAADCTHKSVYYKSCRCGETGSVTFEYGEALGHSLVEHAAAAATCTEMGNSQYWACSRCNTNYRDARGETVIEADEYQLVPRGHTVVHCEAVDATCSHEGHIEHWKCSVCQKIYEDSDCEAETSLEEVVEKQLNHTFETVNDLREGKCSVCEGDVIVLGFDPSSYNPNDYDLTYTVLANDGCIDTYHEENKITFTGTSQNNESAEIYSSSTYTGKYYVSFTGIEGHPNGSSSTEVKFFMYVEDFILKLQYTPVTGGIDQSIVDKMINPRQVLYSGGGTLYNKYNTQLQNGVFLPIKHNTTTGALEGFTIKITQFSAEPITSYSTTVKASLKRTDYSFVPLTKTARNEHKPNTWSYNEEAYYYTFCNYTNVHFVAINLTQTFDEETGILTSEANNYVDYIQLYADFTNEYIDDPSTFQPSKAIFTGEPWGKTFTSEMDGIIYEEINFPTNFTSICYSLEKTYYDLDFCKLDCAEYV